MRLAGPMPVVLVASRPVVPGQSAMPVGASVVMGWFLGLLASA